MRTITAPHAETGAILEGIRPQDKPPKVGNPVVVYDAEAGEYYDGAVCGRNNGTYSVRVGEKRTGRFMVNAIPVTVAPGEGYEDAFDQRNRKGYWKGKFCIATLVWDRIQQPVSDACQTWLSVDVVNQFRKWRREQGKPPIKRNRARRWQNSMAMQGKRRRKAIREFLAGGPRTTKEIARHLGVTDSAAEYQLAKKLEQAGEIERAGTGKRGAILWQLVE